MYSEDNGNDSDGDIEEDSGIVIKRIPIMMMMNLKRSLLFWIMVKRTPMILMVNFARKVLMFEMVRDDAHSKEGDNNMNGDNNDYSRGDDDEMLNILNVVSDLSDDHRFMSKAE